MRLVSSPGAFPMMRGIPKPCGWQTAFLTLSQTMGRLQFDMAEIHDILDKVLKILEPFTDKGYQGRHGAHHEARPFAVNNRMNTTAWRHLLTGHRDRDPRGLPSLGIGWGFRSSR